MARENFLSAVYLLFIKDNKVLLQRRQGTKLWNGYLALPAGHLDSGEDVYTTAIREAKEELSINISKPDISDTFVVNRKNKILMPYFDVYFVISGYEGEIKINEPVKCKELVWADINNLPPDMIDYEAQAIEYWKKGIYFSTFNETNDVISS